MQLTSRDVEVPSCSVVTAAYNAEATIERAIRAVSGQTLQPIEHIVVDDGSTDNTRAIIEHLKRRYPRVVCIAQNNKGAGCARNVGIERAVGRYVAFLDSDDWWEPGKLECQLCSMEKSGTLFSFGDYLEVDVHGRKSNIVRTMPAELHYEDFLVGCPIGCLTVAYNQETLGKVFMPTVRRGQDWGLWLRLTRAGAVARRYPGIEAVYFSGGASLSSTKLRKLLDVYSIYRREGLSRSGSFWFLGAHSLSALRKWFIAG